VTVAPERAAPAKPRPPHTVVEHHAGCPPHLPHGVVSADGHLLACRTTPREAQDLALGLDISDAALAPGWETADSPAVTAPAATWDQDGDDYLDVTAAFKDAELRDANGKWTREGLASKVASLAVRTRVVHQGHDVDRTASKGYRVRLKGGEVQHYEHPRDAAQAAFEGRHHTPGKVQVPVKAPAGNDGGGIKVEVKRPQYRGPARPPLPPAQPPPHDSTELTRHAQGAGNLGYDAVQLRPTTASRNARKHLTAANDALRLGDAAKAQQHLAQAHGALRSHYASTPDPADAELAGVLAGRARGLHNAVSDYAVSHGQARPRPLSPVTRCPGTPTGPGNCPRAPPPAPPGTPAPPRSATPPPPATSTTAASTRPSPRWVKPTGRSATTTTPCRIPATTPRPAAPPS
jgi:hypothetical protein